MPFVKRTEAPKEDNKYYIHVSCGGLNECIKISGKSCLPNCVGYAWGRAYEISGVRPKLSLRNAENWWICDDGYARGACGPAAVPKLGAIVCWRCGKVNNSKDGLGHVAVVEDYDDTYVYLSESGATSKTYWKTRKVLRSTMYLGANYTFQGYIYPEGSVFKPKPVVAAATPEVKKPEVVSFLGSKGYYEYGDSCDEIDKICKFFANNFYGYYFPNSKKAHSVLDGPKFGPNLLKMVNKFQKNTGLKVDGKIGPITLATMKKYGFKEG